MTPFTLLKPSSLREASEMLLEHGEDARPIAGGTALTNASYVERQVRVGLRFTF